MEKEQRATASSTVLTLQKKKPKGGLAGIIDGWCILFYWLFPLKCMCTLKSLWFIITMDRSVLPYSCTVPVVSQVRACGGGGVPKELNLNLQGPAQASF